MNKAAFKPTVATIKDKYYQLFRGPPDSEEGDAGAGVEAGAVASSSGV